MNTFNFQHTDAWIFLCIPKNEPGATKEEILSSADHINQAIPTDEELNGALKRGLDSGLLESKNDKYFYTPKYGEKINSIIEKQKDIFKAWDALEEFLKNFDI